MLRCSLARLVADLSLIMVSPKIGLKRTALLAWRLGMLCAAGCSPDGDEPQCCPRQSDELVEYAPWDLHYQTAAGVISFTDDRIFEYYYRNVTTGAGIRYEVARLRELDEDRLTFQLTLRSGALLPAGDYDGRFEKSVERVDSYCYDYYPYTLYLEKVSATTHAKWIGHGSPCY